MPQLRRKNIRAFNVSIKIQPPSRPICNHEIPRNYNFEAGKCGVNASAFLFFFPPPRKCGKTRGTRNLENSQMPARIIGKIQRKRASEYEGKSQSTERMIKTKKRGGRKFRITHFVKWELIHIHFISISRFVGTFPRNVAQERYFKMMKLRNNAVSGASRRVAFFPSPRFPFFLGYFACPSELSCARVSDELGSYLAIATERAKRRTDSANENICVTATGMSGLHKAHLVLRAVLATGFPRGSARREGRQFLIYSRGFAPDPCYMGREGKFCNERGQCGLCAPSGMCAPSFPLRTTRSDDANLSREMGLEESDFLVFEPLGQKMTRGTISAATGDPSPTDGNPFLSFSFLPPLFYHGSPLMEIITACSLFAPFTGWDLIYREGR